MCEFVDRSRDLHAKILLHKPQLDELADAIGEGIKRHFANVEVSVDRCPDLSTSPYHLAASGIGENLRIGEVGGPGNLFPQILKHKTFDLKSICETCELPRAFVFGPGAGPWQIVGTNCEMIANAVFRDSQQHEDHVETRIARLKDGSLTDYQQLTIEKPQFSLMANLAISDGAPGKSVVHVKAHRRLDKVNFPEAVRQAVAAKYGEDQVSLAGVFILKQGKAKLHIMPDFPDAFKSEAEIASSWLQYFEMHSPLVCCSVLHSCDPSGLGLRLEHTHCFSEHGDAGHYHYDTTPDDVEYEGWFAPAEAVYRIDRI